MKRKTQPLPPKKFKKNLKFKIKNTKSKGIIPNLHQQVLMILMIPLHNQSQDQYLERKEVEGKKNREAETKEGSEAEVVTKKGRVTDQRKTEGIVKGHTKEEKEANQEGKRRIESTDTKEDPHD